MNMNNLFMELYHEKYGNKINRELAEKIVSEMAVTDGSDRDSGEKWTFEESKAVAEKVGIDWEKVSKCEFYIVLNMMYSEHFRTGKKHSLSDIFYAELAYDWFNDSDSDDSKTFRHFIHL